MIMQVKLYAVLQCVVDQYHWETGRHQITSATACLDRRRNQILLLRNERRHCVSTTCTIQTAAHYQPLTVVLHMARKTCDAVVLYVLDRRIIIAGHWQGQLSVKVAWTKQARRHACFVHKSDVVNDAGLVNNTTSAATCRSDVSIRRVGPTHATRRSMC